MAASGCPSCCDLPLLVGGPLSSCGKYIVEPLLSYPNKPAYPSCFMCFPWEAPLESGLGVWDSLPSSRFPKGVQEAREHPLAHSSSPAPWTFFCEPEGWGSWSGAEPRFGRTLPFVKSLYKTQHTVSQIAKHCSITTIKKFCYLSWKLLHKQLYVLFTHGHESILSSVDSGPSAFTPAAACCILATVVAVTLGSMHCFSALWVGRVLCHVTTTT